MNLLIRRRLLHALDNHGLRGLLLRALRRLVPSRASSRTSAAEAPPNLADLLHPFDQLHASDTGGYIPGEQLAESAPSSLSRPDLYNTAYYGISPSTLTEALRHLPLPPDRFTFVDLGCGKGRALLVAATFPFPHILGVEISSNLCEIARRNTTSYPQITIIHHDVTTFHHPETSLILYLYHPFLAPLLRQLLRNLERQFRSSPREIFLLYANPTYPRVVARFPFLKQVWDFTFPLSPEDAAADRHSTTEEHYTLYRAEL